MFWIDEVKAWFLARMLKKPPETILPKPERKELDSFDPPVYIDRFSERRSDPKFMAIDSKIRDAVSILKGKGFL